MEDLFHPNQCYRQVGDNLDAILSELDLGEFELAPELPRSFLAILALVSLFQYSEGYTDPQAAEAARTRADWKYALHLPLDYAGFDPVWLCRLRESAFRLAGGAALIQDLWDRLEGLGLGSPNRFEPNFAPPVQAADILASVCRLNRLVELTEAVLLAVEALGSQQSDGLPALRLAQLYASAAKTFRSLRRIRTSEEAACFASRIGEEIGFLLDLVEGSGEKGLNEIVEVEHLRMVWEQQVGWQEAGRQEDPVWKPVDCRHCSLNTRGNIKIKTEENDIPAQMAWGK